MRFVASVLSLFTLACASRGGDDTLAIYNDSLLKQRARISISSFERDSLYVVLTASAFEINSVSVEVIGIFYSPDSTKMFCLTISQSKDSTQGSGKTYFSGKAYAGFREGLRPWKVYPFQQVNLVRYLHKDSLRDNLVRYYVRMLSKDSQYIRAKDGLWISAEFEYNLVDAGFWKSIIWQKGLILPGLYNFQTNLQYSNPITYSEIEIPLANYPDSLVRLFGR